MPMATASVTKGRCLVSVDNPLQSVVAKPGAVLDCPAAETRCLFQRQRSILEGSKPFLLFDADQCSMHEKPFSLLI